jgi:hypothetical protein
MMNTYKYILCFSLTLMTYAPPAPAKAGGGGCPTQELLNKCRANGMMAGATQGGLNGGGGMYGSTADASSQIGAAGVRVGAAAGQCAASAADCAKCTDPQQKQACEQAVGNAAGQMAQQSAGMGGDASSLLSAAAMMAAAALPMLMQQQQQDDTPPPIPYQGALRPDGTVDCAKPDAWQFAACDDKMAETCKVAMSDSRCIHFANRYCNAAGVGTQYCGTVVAYNFCSDGTKNNCPSCLQLQKETSETCIQSPATCLAQNSPEETEKFRATCPNDPVFVGNGNPVQVANGTPALPGPGTAQGNGPPPANPGLPAPILPASKNPSGGPGQIAVMSVKGSQPGTQPGSNRDAYNNNPTGKAGSGSGYSAMSGSFGSGSARDVASGTIRSTGPAPDVNGQFSPSLFATSSQVIRTHCALGKFNNCP